MGRVSMINEVTAACEWWAHATTCNSSEEEHVKSMMFRDKLRDLVLSHFRGHWYPDMPFRGSAYRTIVKDATVDRLLEEAANATGVDVSRLPRAYVFINPNEVKWRPASCECETKTRHDDLCPTCAAGTLIFGAPLDHAHCLAQAIEPTRISILNREAEEPTAASSPTPPSPSSDDSDSASECSESSFKPTTAEQRALDAMQAANLTQRFPPIQLQTGHSAHAASRWYSNESLFPPLRAGA